MGERARSRLGWGLVVDVHDADYNLRRGILEDKMRRSGIRLSEDVIELLAVKITSNIRELEGALNKLFAHAKLINSDITVNAAYKILKDLLRSNERRVTISEIQKEVSKYYQITLADLTSSRRSRNIARPRQISMYIAKIMTTRSLVEIGAKFGGKDHTTVMHSVKRVEELIKSDDDIAEDIAKIKAILGN
jgi:chromosomal replication initiator protein